MIIKIFGEREVVLSEYDIKNLVEEIIYRAEEESLQNCEPSSRTYQYYHLILKGNIRKIGKLTPYEVDEYNRKQKKKSLEQINN
tara:strand:- start:199 stop:450 length:252 start_codon:yes stop_codon:yes gene_type:complete